MGFSSELASQRADGGLDDVAAFVVGLPDRVEDLLAAHHCAGAGEQKLCQRELDARQRHPPAIDGQLTRLRIEQLDGIDEEAYKHVCEEMAPAFATVPGLQAKLWLADRDTNTYGGVYVFSDADAQAAFAGSDLFAAVVAVDRLAPGSILVRVGNGDGTFRAPG